MVKINHKHLVIRQIIRYPKGYVEHYYCPKCHKIVRTDVYKNDTDGWKRMEDYGTEYEWKPIEGAE